MRHHADVPPIYLSVVQTCIQTHKRTHLQIHVRLCIYVYAYVTIDTSFERGRETRREPDRASERDRETRRGERQAGRETTNRQRDHPNSRTSLRSLGQGRVPLRRNRQKQHKWPLRGSGFRSGSTSGHLNLNFCKAWSCLHHVQPASKQSFMHYSGSGEA